MIFDALEFYGLDKDLSEAGFYKTEAIQELQNKIKKFTLNFGKIIAISGSVGSGKTAFINQIMHELKIENKCVVSYSYSSDRENVNIKTLMTALLLDLSEGNKVQIPTSSEMRDRKLVKLMQELNKPVVLFIDEAQDLHANTLSSLKKLLESAKKGQQKLSIILAGQPKLKNMISSPRMDEVGSRSYIIDLDVFFTKKDRYFEWALNKCSEKSKKISDIITPEASKLLTNSLVTPLQIISHFNKAIEIGFKVGVTPINKEIIEQVLKPSDCELELKYTRAGYRINTIAKMLFVPEKTVRLWFMGKLPEQQAIEFEESLVQANIIV
jgi:type II secretory pathway predicted ATPase ExeA